MFGWNELSYKNKMKVINRCAAVCITTIVFCIVVLTNINASVSTKNSEDIKKMKKDIELLKQK